MSVRTDFILFLLIFNRIYNSYTSAKTLLTKLENCDPSASYAFTLSNVTIKYVDNKQFLDVALILKSPFDNNIRVNSTVEVFTGKNYEYLLSINERKGCDALNKYYGEFVYDLERYGRMIPGMCPLPQGTHQIHNGPLNFDKLLALRVFPLGILRITQNMYNKNNSIYTCVINEINSRI